MMREIYRKINVCWVFVFLIAMSLFGCESITDVEEEDSSIVYIYNYDEDHDYMVELHFVSDDSIVASCYVEEYPDDEYSDSFDDVDEGYFYISVYQDQGVTETGRSGTFHLEEDEDGCFWIDEDGDIKNCY